jgi:ADP-L-glycero-D-manno-heptose 6-epimerase
VVAVKLWFFDHPEKSGIFNLGTGRAQPFNDVAMAVINTLRQQQNETPLTLKDAVHDGLIDYITFPAALVGRYQSYTQADLSALRATGCQHAFADVQTGVTAYMQWLSSAKT